MKTDHPGPTFMNSKLLQYKCLIFQHSAHNMYLESQKAEFDEVNYSYANTQKHFVQNKKNL